jgi:hypothetical protein
MLAPESASARNTNRVVERHGTAHGATRFEMGGLVLKLG